MPISNADDKRIEEVSQREFAQAIEDYNALCRKLISRFEAQYDENQNGGAAVYLGTLRGLVERQIQTQFHPSVRAIADHATHHIHHYVKINYINLQ